MANGSRWFEYRSRRESSSLLPLLSSCNDYIRVECITLTRNECASFLLYEKMAYRFQKLRIENLDENSWVCPDFIPQETVRMSSPSLRGKPVVKQRA